MGSPDWKMTKSKFCTEAFLDICGFDILDFQFNAVYNSILFSSPLVILKTGDQKRSQFTFLFSI